MGDRDWLDDIAAESSERVEKRSVERAHELLSETTFLRLAPTFVANVFLRLDEDVRRWNARPDSADKKIVRADGNSAARCFQLSGHTLNVAYSEAERKIAVDIETSVFPVVTPQTLVDSYGLHVDHGAIVGVRYGGERKGWATSAAEVSREILSTFLRAD